MELSSSFIHIPNPSRSSPTLDFSFSSSLSQFPLHLHFHIKTAKFVKPTSQNLRVFAVAVDPQELPRNSPQRLLKELAQRKRATGPKKKVPPRKFILKPPLDDKKLADRFLNSPQLSLKSFPLLSSCLPSSRLNNADKTWIDEYLLEVKQALGYPLEPSDQLGDDNPAKQFDTLLYLAFQHPSCDRANARHVKSGHSRLWFVGQYVLELAFAEYFLQRYPRESPGPMRERVFGLIGKRNLPKWIKAASLQNLIFPYDDIDKLIRKEREPPVKSVFWALFGAIYLCYGMPEVYRVLFEVFGMDPEAEDCQPKLRRQLEDVDYVSVCVFVQKFADDDFIILLFYVDDMLIDGQNIFRIKKLNEQLNKSFAMKDLGPTRQIIGMKIIRDKSTKKLWLLQERYIEKVLQRFNMNKIKAVSCHLANHFRLSSKQCLSTEKENEEIDKFPYASAVGSLMYAMVYTRPDIAYIVGIMSRFLLNPGKEHQAVRKWILIYLCGTSKLCLCFRDEILCCLATQM